MRGPRRRAAGGGGCRGHPHGFCWPLLAAASLTAFFHSCSPQPLPLCAPAELFFAAAGVLLIALGVPILVASLNVVEYRVPYAFEGPFAELDPAQRQQLLWDTSAAGEDGVRHSVSMLTDKDMNPPVGGADGCWVLSGCSSWVLHGLPGTCLLPCLAAHPSKRRPPAPPPIPINSPKPPCLPLPANLCNNATADLRRL